MIRRAPIVPTASDSRCFGMNRGSSLATRQHSSCDRTSTCGHRLYFASQEYQDENINNKPAINRRRRGTMNELVERRAARAGIEAAVARAAVGTIPDFQCKEGPAD